MRLRLCELRITGAILRWSSEEWKGGDQRKAAKGGKGRGGGSDQARERPRQGKARQGKARQGKERQGKARKGKERQGKWKVRKFNASTQARIKKKRKGGRALASESEEQVRARRL